MNEEQRKRQAIDHIDSLWPPASTDIGKQDLLQALAEHLELLPVEVLESISARQTDRDMYG